MFLAVVAIKSLFTTEETATRTTVAVVLFVMIFEIVLIIEIQFTALTIVMCRTIHIMRDEACSDREVSVTIVADMMRAGVLLVLPQSTSRIEVTIAAIAVRHACAAMERA